MKINPITGFTGFLTFAFVCLINALLVSCGSSADEQRQQEIRDSIKLEKDRKELLERANKLLESAGNNKEKTDDSSSSGQ